MALFACKECGKQISDQARSCPQCGAPVAQQTLRSDNNSALSGDTAKTVVTGLAAWLITTWVARALFGVVALICIAYFLTHSNY